MLWAAWTGYTLRMPEAYAYMPQRDGTTASGTLNVHWIAVQMTASASAG